jgi:phospholipid/cholesterol/gamma-HCH transport system substrate-binding protein
VNAFSARLPGIGEKADVLMTQVGETAGQLLAAVEPERLNRAFASVERAAGTIEQAAGDVRQVTSAIPPETVQAAIQNLSAFSETLGGIGARREEIDAMVTRFSAISSDVNAFSARLPAIGERVEGMVTGIGDTADRLREAVDPEAIGRAVGAVERAAANVEQVTAAVPAEAVRATAENLSRFSAVLAARSPDVDALVTRLSAIAGDVGAFTPRLPAIGEKVDGVLTAVDTQKIGESVEGVHRFTTALGNRSGDVEAILADARATAAQLKGVTAKADSLLAKLDGMAGDEGGGFIAEARATLASIRQTAETFDEQAQSIGGSVNQFSTRGLRDLQNFISEGQRTVARLDRVISSLERDPSQILFGGEGVPEYKGSRSGGAQRR